MSTRAFERWKNKYGGDDGKNYQPRTREQVHKEAVE